MSKNECMLRTNSVTVSTCQITNVKTYSSITLQFYFVNPQWIDIALEQQYYLLLDFVYAEELTLVSIFTGTSGFQIRFEIFSQNFSQIFHRFVRFYLIFRHNRSLRVAIRLYIITILHQL